jgi:hypothetical protein
VDRVIIGVDPHKLSVTIEARDNREILRAMGQFRTDARSYQQLLKVARQWPERIWAVEGANGIGRPVTQRLLASERVLDVPAIERIGAWANGGRASYALRAATIFRREEGVWRAGRSQPGRPLPAGLGDLGALGCNRWASGGSGLRAFERAIALVVVRAT